ncbi:SAM-dependent chlorinase/fluorinase [Candidatus Uhrbacteria bacterium]|nr:SAM-dependent chlorinase/fluorinase [Candidatus Uhrbacteria bacterium]
MPRVAAYLFIGNTLKGAKLSIEHIPDAPSAIWWIDNFGNCKTTLLQEDIRSKNRFSTKFKELCYFERLKDVPDKVPALILGSSGLGEKRFLEVVVQGGSAEKIFNINTEDAVLF